MVKIQYINPRGKSQINVKYASSIKAKNKTFPIMTHGDSQHETGYKSILDFVLNLPDQYIATRVENQHESVGDKK